MDIQTYMQQAMNAQQSGIPVNWQEVAATVFNQAGVIIQDMQATIAADGAKIEAMQGILTDAQKLELQADDQADTATEDEE